MIKNITLKSRGNVHTVALDGYPLYFDTIEKAFAAVCAIRAMFYMEGLR